MNAAAVALLQWQDTKLHARGGCCPAAVTGYQTACAHGCPAAAAVSGSQTTSLSKGRAKMQQQQQQQQQQSKMYTRGALQAFVGKKKYPYP
jgi:hypothetical protein